MSICIPTYNRARFLEKNLPRLIALCSSEKIPIFISDNASNDDTEDVVKLFINKYQFVFYQRLETNFGIDYNMNAVVNMSSTKYSWLFSDDDEMDDNAVEVLCTFLKTYEPDFVLLNSREKNLFTGEIIFENYLGIRNLEYLVNSQFLLENYVNQMTLLSACVVKTIDWKKTKIEDYKSKYYFHIHNVFNNLDLKSKILIIGGPIFTKFTGNIWNFDESQFDYVLNFFYPLTIDNLSGKFSYNAKIAGIKTKINKIRIGTFLRLRADGHIGFNCFPPSYFRLLGLHLPLAVIALLLPKYLADISYKIGTKIIGR